MAGKGGYQRPANPAPVSGPGRLSRRTDGGPSVDNPTQAARYISGLPYGEGKEVNGLANAAPLSAAPQGAPMPKVTGLSEPTERPDEPVTAGMPFGEGPGPEVLPDVDGAAREEGLNILRAMYVAMPTIELRRLLERAEAQARR